jgi:hypothetical protein
MRVSGDMPKRHIILWTIAIGLSVFLLGRITINPNQPTDNATIQSRSDKPLRR